MGDFLGFKYGGVRSDDLGIIRTSSGDRFEEELFSDFKDRTAEVPGADGEYYFGSGFSSRKIEIDFAFDSLTEVQFRELRKIFGQKEIKELIFDERPYKKYMAKVESPIELSYICFDEPMKIVGEERDGVRVKERSGSTITRERVTPYVIDYSQTQRIYKGEGKISFICYYPFAKSVYKQLPFNYQLTEDEDIDENKTYYIFDDEEEKYEEVEDPVIDNIESYYEKVTKEEVKDWAISSGILSAEEYKTFDKYDSDSGEIKIYNCGDLETGFRLYIPAAALASAVTLEYKKNGINTHASLILKAITLETGDIGILIDTNNELIVGVSEFGYNISGNAIYSTSGHIYNKYINSGHFFHFEPNSKNSGTILSITNGVEGIEIFYDYLYF